MPPGYSWKQHYRSEGACIIDLGCHVPLESAHEHGAAHCAGRPAGTRARWCCPVNAVWLFLRAESRRRWRAWPSLALIVGVFTGGVVMAAAGRLRTGFAYARFLDWSRAPDSLVGAEPYDSSFARHSPLPR
jgi:hypothetical protein